jgi:hypothetical protein
MVDNAPQPDLFQNVQAIQPQQISADAGNNLFKPIAEGVQAMGDNLVALLEGALNKVVNFGASALAGRGGSDHAYSTGRFEDPGFAPSAPVVAAATQVMAKGQSIEGPAATVGLAKNDVHDVGVDQHFHLAPLPTPSKAPSKEQGVSLG